MNSLDLPAALDLLRTMRLIRETELQLAQLFADGEIPGFIHLSIGQEGVAAGVMTALRRDDTLASNHRGHGHALAKGLDLDGFFHEIMGNAEGLCGGRGGSMHVADMRVGMLGANGIVAAGIPIAVGSALAHSVRGTGSIAAVFFGDGALAEGVLHESLNLAALWKLPVLFVCENNGWSEFSPTSLQFRADPTGLAQAHGIAATHVDGNDVLAVAEAATALVGEIREGGGPRFLECSTIRVRGHFEGDPQKYRNDGDGQITAADDPIARLEKRLEAHGAAEEVARIARGARERVTAAIAVARRGQPPQIADALRGVYTQSRAR